MADQKPLLRKGGKLARIGGKLVRSDNPALCPCCGDCECFDPAIEPRIIQFQLNDLGDEIEAEWFVQWPAPQTCDNKYTFEFDIFGKGGALIVTLPVPAFVNVTRHIYRQKKTDVCDNPNLQIASVQVSLVDPNNVCPSRIRPWPVVADYDDLCPKCKWFVNGSLAMPYDADAVVSLLGWGFVRVENDPSQPGGKMYHWEYNGGPFDTELQANNAAQPICDPFVISDALTAAGIDNDPFRITVACTTIQDPLCAPQRQHRPHPDKPHAPTSGNPLP